MSNTIELAKSFVPKLDECYRLASLTSVLDGAPELAKQGANANELIIPMMSMDGLADYSRNGGYVQGGVTMTNETVKCNFDRGRRFDVDVMDDLETAGLAFGRLSAQFIRDKVVPELDAFRFASYCGISGVTKKEETLADGAATVAALSAAVTAMDDEEVTATGRYLFITPTLLQGINDMDTTKSKKVLEGFEQVIKVPQRRFYTAIKQLSGKTGEEAGGYTKAAGAANINFAIVQKDALIQYTKHAAPKIIAPENNRTRMPTSSAIAWWASPRHTRICCLACTSATTRRKEDLLWLLSDTSRPPPSRPPRSTRSLCRTMLRLPRRRWNCRSPK